MKLRIKGNSLRLRISQTEMRRLIAEGSVSETICFGSDAGECLTYALEHRASSNELAISYRERTVTVLLPTRTAAAWAQGDEPGIYGSAVTAAGPLELIVEKDFACLDGNDPADLDAFPNPQAGLC